MRVLLSDGSGLTARQVATQLACAGHHVQALSPAHLCLSRFTRHVRRVHRVPACGAAPLAWLDKALEVARTERVEVLFPTQEQVAVIAAGEAQLRDAGVATAVPAFSALARVHDKLASFSTLQELGIPQPAGEVLTSAAELARWSHVPAYVKLPIGTAMQGVVRLDRMDQAGALAARLASDGSFADGGVLVQQPVDGPLTMVQSVFDHGLLVAFHANARVREGTRGGACNKRSMHAPALREQVAHLGSSLGWHGGLAADIIIGPDGPVWIDVNPRLVEPGNAWHAGVDLVGALLAVATSSGTVKPQPDGGEGVATHQLLLAMSGAAQGKHGRRAVVREVTDAIHHRGVYQGSAEELLPWRGDPQSLLLLAVAGSMMMLSPRVWRRMVRGAVAQYALSADAWRTIRAAAGRWSEPRPGS